MVLFLEARLFPVARREIGGKTSKRVNVFFYDASQLDNDWSNEKHNPRTTPTHTSPTPVNPPLSHLHTTFCGAAVHDQRTEAGEMRGEMRALSSATRYDECMEN